MKTFRHYLMIFIAILGFTSGSSAQCGPGQAELFISSSGGSFSSEKWVQITTDINGAGTVIWAQGDGTYGNGAGLLTDEPFCVDEGVTYYITAYDAYADGWDGTIYEIKDASGTIVANNGGASPSDGTDNDFSGSFNDTQEQEIEVSEAFSYTTPSCLGPSTLMATNITTSSADLSWTENGTATAWNIEWGTVDFELGTGTMITATGDNPYNLSGLDAQSNYDFYVQADCGGSQSDWIGPYNFSTLACDVSNQCAYSIYMADQYSDSWNGASIDILQSGILLSTISLASGPPTTETINLCDDVEIELIWTAGSYPNECSFSITDPFGIEVYSFGQGEAPSAGSFFTFTSECTASTETDFLTFSFVEQSEPAVIDTENHTIDIEIIGSATLIDLIASFTLSSGATVEIAEVSQESGITVNDFSSVVIYTVTAQDGSSMQDWTINVSQVPINTETDFLTFSFDEETMPATINTTDHMVDINIAWNADISDLIADFTLSSGATADIADVLQESGVTANDFTATVIYTITAEDLTYEQDWLINVTKEDTIAGANCNFPIEITEFPFSSTGNNTADYGDFYTGSGPCVEMNYLQGYEVVYTYTPSVDEAFNITISNLSDTYAGVQVMDNCPDAAPNCVGFATNLFSTNDLNVENLAFTAGTTYYIIVSTWPAPESTEYDIEMTQITCPVPHSLSASNIVDVSAELEWTTGGAANWNIEWAESGFTPGEGNMEYNVSLPFSISGLTPETEYEFYVQDSCETDDLSEWAGPYSFITLASCPLPTELMVSNITTNAADFSWDGAFASMWDIEYGPMDFAPTGTPTFEDISEAMYNFTELIENTSYDVYVRADCGSEQSEWVGPLSFTTNCNPLTELPYTENFDGDWDCWKVVNVDGGNTWSQDDTYLDPLSGEWVAHGMGNNDDYLISPHFSLGELEANTALMLSWWDVVESETRNNTYDVLVSTTDSEIASFTDSLTTIDCSNTDWLMHSIDLSAYAGSDIFIAFHQTYSAATNWGFGIDDFELSIQQNGTDFISYSFPEEFAPAMIDDVNHEIHIELLPETVLSALTTMFTLSEGAVASIDMVEQESEVTVNDFTDPVIYTVEAENGDMQDWTIYASVHVLSSDNDILSFSFEEQTGAAVINDEDHTVAIEVEYGTDVSDIVPTYTLSMYATTDQMTTDFTDLVIYTIEAENGITQDWTVTVSIALNSENDILSFSFTEETGAAMIDDEAYTVDIEVEYGTMVSDITPTYTLSMGATTDQTTTDFSAPVIYTVTAENGDTQDWTVTVSVALNSENDILSFSFTEETGAAMIDDEAYTVDIEVEYGTMVSDITPNYTLSMGATTDQTTTDFSSPVIYTIEAENGDTQDWTVTVSVEAGSSEAEFLSFSIDGAEGVIDSNVDTILVVLPASTEDLMGLVASFEVSPLSMVTVASVEQESGVTSNDWTEDGLEYTIIAQDGTERTWMVYVDLTSSISQLINADQINIYPNPSQGIFKLDIDLQIDENINIEVNNIQGKTVLSHENININQISLLDMSMEAEGMYFVKVMIGNKQIIKKVNIIK